MLDWLLWGICWGFMMLGCLFIVAGAVGLIRLPDLYTRLHAAGLADTGGTIFVLLALFLQSVFVFGHSLAAIKISLILFFTLITSPTASHTLAKTALLSGHVPTDENGLPILDSPETAQVLARSRQRKH
jgi:multicomponent Na+:H+ antiporter subunit G